MTLKMVIAEDEQAFRDGIVSSINWKLYDIEIVGEAEHGRQALDMMLESRADLLLTDIRMPHLNGLDLIRAAKEAGIDFHSILLTGYNEFDYAKEAIKLGVSDYLLKPCMPHDILRVVIDVKKKIDAAEFEGRMLTERDRTWNRSIQLLKNGILSQWIQQPLMPLEERTVAMREVNLALQPEPIVVGRIEIDAMESGNRGMNNRDLELMRYAILNITDETLRPYYNGKLEVFRHGDELLWMANVSSNGGRASDSCEPLQQLKRNLESYLHLSVSFSLSSVQPSVNDARTAYEEACKALESRFYQGKGGIFLYSKLNMKHDGKTSIMDDPYLERVEKELLAHLQVGQYGGAVDAIEAGISYLKQQTVYSRSEIIWRVSGIIMALQRLAQERFPGTIEWQNDLVNWIERIPNMETLDDCSVILQMIVQSIVQTSPHQKQLHRTVQATLELIRAKYDTNLTLELAAKETFVSNSYLSSLFKQELGVNFLDYLHQYRVERAKELLREHFKIYAVAKLVGYGEERHFSSTFKKWTGMTPSQFQKRYAQAVSEGSC
ncbi:response regulator [Paenibacillus nanensis]|uniref:Response regulator n=1 Tax=Paenibacillus nanensis TaxID=393251 RepID=A0A3A1VJQ9_9BACL|nr:helix-turn-helix domain-containing protein [Paenibacillus nanensis]RIX60564.1 response regulator [Paenibacillus nanensis]